MNGNFEVNHKLSSVKNNVNSVNLKNKKRKRKNRQGRKEGSCGNDHLKEKAQTQDNLELLTNLVSNNILKKGKEKRTRTISFTNATETPKSGKIQRQCTPYRNKSKNILLENEINECDFSSNESLFETSENKSSCGIVGATDSSIVSTEVDIIDLFPTTSEFDKPEYSIRIKESTDSPKKMIKKRLFNERNVSRNSSLNIHFDNSIEKDKSNKASTKRQKTKKKIQTSSLQIQYGKSEQNFKTESLDKNSVDLLPSRYFDIDIVHFDGNVADPLSNISSQREVRVFSEIPRIKIPDISYKVEDVEINIWDKAAKNETFESDLNETYSEFCSKLDSSFGHTSLEDSVFASDIFPHSEPFTTSNDLSVEASTEDIDTEFYSGEEISIENDLTPFSEEISVNISENDFNLQTDNVYDKDRPEIEVLNGFNSQPINDFAGSYIDDSYDYEDPQTAVASFFQLENLLIIVLKPESKLYVHGHLLVTVLQGAINVLGYKLTPSSQPARIYSPQGTGFLYLQTLEENNIADLNAHPRLKELHAMIDENSSLAELLKDCQPNDTILYCENFQDRGVQFMEQYIPQMLFPRPDESGVRCIFQDRVSDWSVFTPNEEWEHLINVSEADKVLICGGKGVGKSTMLKYCVNRLLFKYTRVLVIDLDPGQPEFTVPGCVSAVVVEEPLFGPNYTHLRRTERSIFINNIDVSREPEQYLSAVIEIINFSKTLVPMATFVNYMGYSKGLGVDLLAAVIALLSPTVVVQVESKYAQRNFEKELTPQYVEERAKLFLPSFEDPLLYQHIIIGCVATDKKRFRLPARQLREMCILSYFGQTLPSEVALLTDTRVPIYEVSLSSINIICGKKEVPPLVANGNLVALCSKEQGYENFICIGWGIVRGVDIVANRLYLITPVPSEDLEQVNHLVIGSVFLPFHLSTETCDGLIPYVSQGVLSVFGQIPKRIQDYARRKVNVY